MRKKKAAAKDNAERWLLTYADLITLLMVFFVLLFAMSKIDAKKFQELAGSLQRAFNVTVLQGSQPVSVSDSPAASKINLLEQQDLQRITQTLAQFATSNAIMPGQITTQQTSEGIAVTISGVLLFYNGTNQLKPDGILLLQQIGGILSGMANPVRIEGHTDDIPVTDGPFASNWELSAARAVAVTRFLAEQQHIAPQRLSAVGFGQYQPIVPNDTRAHREMNRRAVIVILYPQPTSVLPTPSGSGAVTLTP